MMGVMKMIVADRVRTLRWLAFALLSVLPAACSGVEPFAYTEVQEIPPGPGLISGETGEFELYRR